MSELDAGDQQVMNTIQQFLRNMPSSGGNSDVKFNKKLLDFDYSDDEDGGGGVDFSEPTPQMLDALSNILGNDRLLGKLKVYRVISVGLWNFKDGGSSKARFLAKNQYTQRKPLSFENTGSTSLSKIGHEFRK